MGEESSIKIVISGMSFTGDTDLYAVLYVDENWYNHWTVDLSNSNNVRDRRSEFVLQEPNTQQSRAQLVVDLRRKGTFFHKRIGKFRIKINELFEGCGVGRERDFNERIMRTTWFWGEEEVGRLNFTYRFENSSTAEFRCCCQTLAVLERVVPCFVACLVGGAPAGGSLIGNCFCLCPVYITGADLVAR
uniref:Uncharacterized protein n=1 Tax=Nelumbo nucifera TaxID=4432 RepID=A0A822Z8W1_NELNU|nr:TPA_asm: hypothetical protein HUJ06_013839 [Nelumbo nucifera]